MTFSGSVDVGEKIMDDLEVALTKGDQPLQSSVEATERHDLDADVTMIMAYRQEGTARLAVYNVEGDRHVQGDVQWVQCGSMKGGYHELTDKCLKALMSIGNIPQRILVQGLALLQSYGVHDYLIEHGVGGGFCGLYVDNSGLHWQPDILYLVVHPQFEDVGMVGSFARHNIWCLFSSMIPIGTLVLAHEGRDESGELFRQRASPIVRVLEEKNDRGEFDYIVVLSTGRHVVTVIEMLGHHEHALLMVEPDPDIAGRIGIYWAPQLQDAVDQIVEPEDYTGTPHDLTIAFQPYRSLGDSLPSDDRRQLRGEWKERRAIDDNAGD